MQVLSWHNLRHFVATILSPLLRHERDSAVAAQADLNNEYLLRMGALAAGAAHDLRSPLTTLAVLVDELRQQPDADDRRKLAENLRIMSDQIEECRHILAALAAYGQEAPLSDKRMEPADRFLHASKERERLGPSNDNAVSRKGLQLFRGQV